MTTSLLFVEIPHPRRLGTFSWVFLGFNFILSLLLIKTDTTHPSYKDGHYSCCFQHEILNLGNSNLANTNSFWSPPYLRDDRKY